MCCVERAAAIAFSFTIVAGLAPGGTRLAAEESTHAARRSAIGRVIQSCRIAGKTSVAKSSIERETFA